jgi:hypothetical protein
VPIINYEGWAYAKSNFRWCEQGGDMDSITDLSFENYSPLSGRLHSTVKVLEGFGELGEGRMSWGQPHEEGQTVPVVYPVENEKTDEAYPIFAFDKGAILDTTSTDTLYAAEKRVGFFAFNLGVSVMTEYGKHLLLSAIYWCVGQDMPLPVQDVPGNAVYNNEFDEGIYDWGYYFADDGTYWEIVNDAGLAGDNAAKITIDDDITSYWKAQFKNYARIDPVNPVYALTFMARTAAPDTLKDISVELFGRKGGKESIWVGNKDHLIQIDDKTIHYGPYYVYGREGDMDGGYDAYELSFNGGNDGVDFYLDSIVMVPYTDTIQPVVGDIIKYQRITNNMSLIWEVEDNVGHTTTYLYKDGAPVDTLGAVTGTMLMGLTENEEYFYEVQVADPHGNLSPKQNAYFIFGDNMVINPEFNAGAVSDSVDTEYGYHKSWFADGAGSWSVVQDAGLSGENAAFIDMDDAGGSYWKAQFKALPQGFETGNVYALYFMAKCEADTSKLMSVELFGRTPEGKANIWVGNSSRLFTIDDNTLHYGPFYIYEKDGKFSDDYLRYELSFNGGNDNVDFWLDSIVVVPSTDDEQPWIGDLPAYKKVGDDKMNITWEVEDNVGITTTYLLLDGTPVDTLGNAEGVLLEGLTAGTEYPYSIQVVDAGGNPSPVQNAYFTFGANLVLNPEFNAGPVSDSVDVEYLYHKSWFADGAGSWSVVQDAGLSGENAALIDMEEAGGTYWKAQFKALPVGFETGNVYALTLQAKTAEAGVVKTWSTEVFGRGPDGKANIWTGNSENSFEVDGSTIDYGPFYIWERDGDFSDAYSRYELSLNCGSDNHDVYIDNIVVVPYTDEEDPVVTSVDRAESDLFTIAYEATDNVGIKQFYISKNGNPVDTVAQTLWKDTEEPAEGDIYGVIAVDPAGNISAEVTYTWVPVGVPDQYASPITVYPNPAGRTLSIRNIESVDRIEIFHITGKMLRSVTNDNQSVITLNIEEFNQGTYLIRFHKKDGSSKIGRFVKK